MMHQRFMGHQSYVLLCSKMTSLPPSEGVSKITLAPSNLSSPCLVPNATLTLLGFQIPHFSISQKVQTPLLSNRDPQLR